MRYLSISLNNFQFPSSTFYSFQSIALPPPWLNLFLGIVGFFFFLAALHLHCCVHVFSSCSERGLLLVVVHGLLIAVASLVAEHRLQECGLHQLQHVGSVVVACRLSSCGSWALECRLSSCGPQAQLLLSMCDLPELGIKPVSFVLAGGFFTTVPPGKSHRYCIF